MNNGIRSLPQYQHGGPHPTNQAQLERLQDLLQPPFDAEAFREAVRQGWTVNPLPTAAEQAEEGIRSMVELAADNEPVWQSMERFWASQGEPPPEFPPAPRQESVEDQIKRLLSSGPDENAFRALERKAAFEKLLKDVVALSPADYEQLSPEDLSLYRRRLKHLGGPPDKWYYQELPWELLSPEDRELTPYRSPGKRFSQSHWTVRPSPPDVDPPIRRGISRLSHRAGRAVRNVGIAGLKAIRNRLPSVIGAGLATAAASHPASAAVDIALSPTPMGSGDMPKRDPRSNEDRMKYYDDLMSLQRELGVGQHGPSISQLSREISGPSIRSSYPMGR